MKVAVTVLAAVKVMLHVEDPEQAPDHPENELFCAGVPVRTTSVFWEKLAEQVAVEPEVQLIPAGLLVTVPMPAPCSVTVMENSVGGGGDTGVVGTPAHPNMKIAGSAHSQRHSWFRRQIMRNVLTASQNLMRLDQFRLLPISRPVWEALGKLRMILRAAAPRVAGMRRLSMGKGGPTQVRLTMKAVLSSIKDSLPSCRRRSSCFTA